MPSFIHILQASYTTSLISFYPIATNNNLLIQIIPLDLIPNFLWKKYWKALPTPHLRRKNLRYNRNNSSGVIKSCRNWSTIVYLARLKCDCKMCRRFQILCFSAWYIHVTYILLFIHSTAFTTQHTAKKTCKYRIWPYNCRIRIIAAFI